MKKAIKIIIVVLVVALIAIQFFRPDRTNPAINDSDTLIVSMQVPPQVGGILERSCNDCHSNKTVYPWYTNIAPISWWLSNHISEGRSELNMSVWNTYTAKRKLNKLEAVCEQVRSGDMPLPSYLWIHRDAVLREGDAKTICDWTDAERAKMAAAPPPAN
ncbi:MAG: heme-binding domain-containing protein [Candidatus Binatia bacterium]